MTTDKWHNVCRIVHLQGGIRAINNPGSEIIIIPGPDNNPNKKFNISRYPELIASLAKQGLLVIGVDFYEMANQIKGHLPPTFRSVHMRQASGYPAWEAEDVWSCLANAGFEKGDIEFADICRRITFEIRATNWRLRELSEAYNSELTALSEMKKFKEGTKFESRNSFFIYLSTHALLVEICTLRDYIAEFIANYILHKYLPNSNITIKTMSGLRKKILPIASKDNIFAKELYDITDENSNDPWLIRLGAYRNLVVHFVPLIDATHRGFLVQKILRSKNAENYPSIFFPIPPNPIKIEKMRTKGLAFSTVEEWLKASANYDCDKDAAPDALDYCSEVVGRMMILANHVAKISLISPKRAELTQKDIIGPISFDTT